MALVPGLSRSSRRRNVVDGQADLNGPEPQATHGHWWIKNHRLCQTVYLQDEGVRGCEIVFGDVYHMKRIDLNQVDQ